MYNIHCVYVQYTLITGCNCIVIKAKPVLEQSEIASCSEGKSMIYLLCCLWCFAEEMIMWQSELEIKS